MDLRNLFLARRRGIQRYGGLKASRLEIIGNCLIVIDSEMLRVSANKSFIKDAPGQLLEVFFLDSAQKTHSDLGGHAHFVQGHPLFFAFFA